VTALLALFVALVAEDAVVLRAAPRDLAPAQAQLFRGDWLEVRGEEPGWLKVYDHRRERPGYVRPGKVRVHPVEAAEAPALRAVVAFLRDAPGFESLGIGAAALAMRCDPKAPAPEMQAAVGAMAERLAARASSRRQLDSAVAAHREVTESYGVRYLDVEGQGRVQVCYDGAAFRQVLADPGAPAEDRARAVLSLTAAGCVDAAASPHVLRAWNEWRLDVLGRVEPGPGRLGALQRLRRAEVLSWLTFQHTRGAQPERAAADAEAALKELALADPALLAEEDLPLRAEAALRVAASRWAGEKPQPAARQRPYLTVRAGRPGETCVSAVAEEKVRAERCTYGLVWESSARGRGPTLTIAVQPAESWTELWVFRRVRGAWRVQVIPPASEGPGIGYVEAAGFSAGGSRLLAVREAMVRGKLRRSFEVRRAADLRVLASAASPDQLGGFTRWSTPDWRGRTLALR
jgi:hypothetical protein